MASIRPDNIPPDIRDQVIHTLLEEKRSAPLVADNYDAIERLTKNFAKYIDEHKIPVPPQLISRLTSFSSAEKIAFVKQHLCPIQQNLRAMILHGCKTEKIVLNGEVIDKCVRFLGAMIEVATA